MTEDIWKFHYDRVPSNSDIWIVAEMLHDWFGVQTRFIAHDSKNQILDITVIYDPKLPFYIEKAYGAIAG